MTDLKINDILESTWGYEQTNVYFYKVIGFTAKYVKIQKIGTIRQYTDGFMEYKAVPDENQLKGKPMLRKVSTCMGRESVNPSSFESASKWEGRPVIGTSYA